VAQPPTTAQPTEAPLDTRTTTAQQPAEQPALPTTTPTEAPVACPEEPVASSGPFELPPSYQPAKRCVDTVLSYEPFMSTRVPQLRRIVEDCQIALTSISSTPANSDIFEKSQLLEDEAQALVFAMYELSLNSSNEENFFFQINEIIRRCDATEMSKICDYLYYLFSGLRKLQPWQGVVYCSYTDAASINTKYVQGSEVRYEMFHHCTDCLEKAKMAAGPTGAVVKLTIKSGRCVTPFVLNAEDNSEVLIPPNACVIVTEALHPGSDGYQLAAAIEKAGTFHW